MANLHLVTGYAGRAHVTAEDHGSLFDGAIRGGNFVLEAGNKFSASAIAANTIRVLDGELVMRGRHVKLDPGSYVDLTIETGSQGYSRNDLIVARYTRDSSSGIEECNLVVIKGNAAESSPEDPEYTTADPNNTGTLQHDFPLYRVPLTGVTIGTMVALFTPEKSLYESNSGKADKVTNATSGNLASLDANGNLQDSGRKPGAAGGVATLDSEGKVPSEQLPSMDYIPTSQKAAANGVASLGSDGKVPSGQLNLSSSVSSTSTTTVANSAAVKTAYDAAVSASAVTTGSGSVVDGGSGRISTILTNSVTWRKFGRVVFVTVHTVIVYSYIGQSGGVVPLSFRVENLPEMETNSCIAIVGSGSVASVESSSFSSYEDAYCGELYNNADYVDVGVLFPAYMHDNSVSNWKTNPTGYKFSYTVTIIGFAK